MVLRQWLFVFPVALTLSLVNGAPVVGPYQTWFGSYTYKGMDETDQNVDVWYPIGGADQKFPFVSYAHGRKAGGPRLPHAYGPLLSAMSAFGYVIAAHESCSLGCANGTTLPNEPRGFGSMYNEQLKVIEWAKQQGAAGEAVFKSVNFDIGVGISGHSMGGEATVYSSSSYGSGHGIKAAVMHHAWTRSYPPPLVPFLAFTGTGDVTAPPYMTRSFYDAKGANAIRGFVNKIGAVHSETYWGYQELATYSAAWFKVFLDKTPQENSVDYESMIFGNEASSLCHGGDGAMEECTVHDGVPTTQFV